jgi:type VI secretion system protein ImpL
MTALYVIFAVALVALVALLVLWFYLKRRKQAPAESESGAETTSGDEIGLAFHEAANKLSAATVAKGARIGELPVYLLLGDSGTAKTSVMLHSGVEPELLAGQVYHDRDILPTRTANLWFGQGAVFVEAGGALPAALWSRLVRRLRPSKVLSREQAAARAAVVCFDCENFTRSGAQEFTVSAARNWRARLGELSESLGINLPVYVLFTKIDRLPFFLDYVRNLSNEEAQQVLGVTLPMARTEAAGVYGEQQTARLSGEFERLFRSLADARPEFLARETDPGKLPGAYEFPREFRKIRLAAVQFLVDLCRPSQLTVGPFLRGFYFTGVRPVIVNEAAPVAPAPSQPAAPEFQSDATSIFRPGARPQVPQAAAPQLVTRRVPQWLFLSHLFHHVLLKDRNALGASGASTRTSFMRRALFATAAASCLIWAIALTISFFGNQALKSQVSEAVQGVPSTAPASTDLASLDQLRRLDALRNSLETLTRYQREGAPWHDRWGLYIGDSLYSEARPIYFDRFRKLLFAQTQAQIVQYLDTLPATPGPEYSPTYDALKAYLITTSNPDKSTSAFLTPALMKWWSNARTIDAESTQLARKQFDFYANTLPRGNPFSNDANAPVVEGARRYLARFAGIDRVYAFMLSEAAAANPPINFNRQFPGTAQVVVESHEVPGAFSRSGWKYMKNAIAHVDRYFSGEQWVLGNSSSGQIDRARLVQDLNERYSADMIKEWRAYIQSAAVVRYNGLKDASQKLMQLSGNQSPLLMLLSVASQNTAVDDQNVVNAFQPVQAVVPPGSTDRFIAPSNQNYMNALVTLQSSLDGLANQPGPPADAAAAQTLANAAQAKVITRQMAQAFRVDAAGRLDAAVGKLLEDPITYIEGLLRALGPAELNSKGKSLCGSVRSVMTKYPFNPNATTDATMADVDGVFRKPDGALWSFYDQNLQKLLVAQGDRYVPAPAGGVTLTPSFVAFFNSAASFSDALYAGGSKEAHFKFTLRPEPVEGIQNMSVQIDGQTLAYSGKPVSKEFTWQAGAKHSATATVKFGNGPDLAWSDNEGLWAVFRFFGKAERRQPIAGAETLDWVIRIGKDPVKLPGGKPLTVRLTLDMESGPSLFQPGYFARMGCPADVAR